MALACAAGCDVEDGAEAGGFGEDAVTPREYAGNGWSLNGWRLNGWRLNGWRLNGWKLQGDAGSGDYIRMVAIDLPNTADDAKFGWLVGSNMHVKTDGGKILGGTQLTGAVIHYVIQENGAQRDTWVRINSAQLLGGTTDTWVYDLDIKDEGYAWEPLCTDGDDVPTEAILLGAVWDPGSGNKVDPSPSNTVTYACRGAALAKCVELGYRPWATKDGVSLAAYHQACTRMVRADYCGDGTPHTVDGVSIHMMDDLDIQTEDAAIPYGVEAEWSASGATCLNPENKRIPDAVVGCQLPKCGGSDFASGGVLQSGTVD